MNIQVSPQQLPNGACPASLQEMLNLFSAYQFVTIPDANSQIVWQANKPSDASVTWGQTDGLGRPVRIYRFAQGAWLSQHSVASGLTMWWFSALPDFTTFDGGDANPAGPASGPMWQQAKDSNSNIIAAKFVISAGTLPSTKVLNLGDTGGEETHSLSAAEMPPHSHQVANTDVANNGAQVPIDANKSISAATNSSGGSFSAYTLQGSITPPTVGPTQTIGGAGSPPVVSPHNTLPLYVVGYLLQRTSRQFFAVT